MSSIGENMSEDEFKSLMREADLNGDGEISYDGKYSMEGIERAKNEFKCFIRKAIPYVDSEITYYDDTSFLKGNGSRASSKVS